MRISHRHKFIFIAYPRTGGSTVGRILDPYSDIRGGHIFDRTESNPYYDHMRAKELHRVFMQQNWAWENYWTFSFVRNPFDRLLSLFVYRRKTENGWDNRNRTRGNINNILLRLFPKKLAFSYFIATQAAENKSAANLKSFIFSDHGELLVKEIYQFEHFVQNLQSILNYLGIETNTDQIPHLNRNKFRINPEEYYTDWTRKKVSSIYRYEFERFGYDSLL